MISYAPLWATMKAKGHTTYTLRQHDEGGVSSSSIRRMKAGDSVSTNTLNELCRIMDCTLPDVVVYIPDDPAAQPKK